MKSDGQNCISCSCSPFDFSSLPLKMTLFLCFLSLNLTITFSLFFIRWQAWRSSGVTLVPVKENAWHALFSKSVLGIDWGKGLTSMVSLRTYWVLFRALRSKLVIRFSSRELQFSEIKNSEFSLSYFLIKSLNRILSIEYSLWVLLLIDYQLEPLSIP